MGLFDGGGMGEFLKALKIVGATMQDMGASADGRSGGNLDKLQQGQNYQDLLRQLMGQPSINAVQSTPGVNVDDPAGTGTRGDDAAASRLAIQNAPADTYSGPLAQAMGQKKANMIAPLLGGMGPQQGLPLLLSSIGDATDNTHKYTAMGANGMFDETSGAPVAGTAPAHKYTPAGANGMFDDATGSLVPGSAPPKEPKEVKPPQMRTIQRGMNRVSQQFNEATGQWEDIPGATGAYFKPDAPKSTSGMGGSTAPPPNTLWGVKQ